MARVMKRALLLLPLKIDAPHCIFGRWHGPA